MSEDFLSPQCTVNLVSGQRPLWGRLGGIFTECSCSRVAQSWVCVQPGCTSSRGPASPSTKGLRLCDLAYASTLGKTLRLSTVSSQIKFLDIRSRAFLLHWESSILVGFPPTSFLRTQSSIRYGQRTQKVILFTSLSLLPITVVVSTLSPAVKSYSLATHFPGSPWKPDSTSSSCISSCI